MNSRWIFAGAFAALCGLINGAEARAATPSPPAVTFGNDSALSLQYIAHASDGTDWGIGTLSGSSSPVFISISHWNSFGILGTYTTTCSDCAPSAIAQGADGAMWFTLRTFIDPATPGNDKIGRVTTDGAITLFPLPDAAKPISMTAGADGRLWLTLSGMDAIGVVDMTGALVETHSVPSSPAGLTQIVAASDNRLWFLEEAAHKIAAISTDGTITPTDEYAIPPTVQHGLNPMATSGGKIWLADEDANNIVEFDVQTKMSAILPAPRPYSHLSATAAVGGDGYAYEDSKFGFVRVEQSGALSEIKLLESGWGPRYDPTEAGWAVGIKGNGPVYLRLDSQLNYFATASDSSPHDGALANDGSIWFTESGAGSASKIGRLDVNGALTQYDLAEGAQPHGIAIGSDGNVWFTEAGVGRIGYLASGSLTEFSVSTVFSYPEAIAAGNGMLWFTEQGASKIGSVLLDGTMEEIAIPVTPSDLTLDAQGNP